MSRSKRKTPIFAGGRFNLLDRGYTFFVRNRTYGTVVMLLEESFHPKETVRSAMIAAKWTPQHRHSESGVTKSEVPGMAKSRINPRWPICASPN
jgi:hypothetical protein